MRYMRGASIAGAALLLLSMVPIAFAAPMALNPMMKEASSSSLNWAGYYVNESAGSVTGVQGSFIVPAVTCSKGSSYVALWAGVDGATDSTVEQAGVMVQCGHGSASYSAWTEFYPAAPTYASWVPAPGDIVSVDVTCSAVSGGASCTATVVDQTTGGSYFQSSLVSGAQLANAECITERPAIAGSITKLADFGTAQFGQDYTSFSGTCYATIDGSTSPFGNISTVTSITMVDSHGKALATTSPLSTDGSSFTVTYGSGSSGGGSGGGNGGGHGHKP